MYRQHPGSTEEKEPFQVRSGPEKNSCVFCELANSKFTCNSEKFSLDSLLPENPPALKFTFSWLCDAKFTSSLG